jgi:hypothetical protein
VVPRSLSPPIRVRRGRRESKRPRGARAVLSKGREVVKAIQSAQRRNVGKGRGIDGRGGARGTKKGTPKN